MTVGPAPQSHDRGKWRTNARDAALPFERFHQRRLFADFIGARAGVHKDVEIDARAEDVLADEAARVSVGNGLLHDLDQVAIFAAQIDVAGLRADRERGDHHAFNDGVRIVLEDEAVFAGAGLALVTVAQHVLRLGRLLGHERPLHAGRKSRAAAAAQVRLLHLVDDGVGRHAERFLQRLVAVELEIAVERGRAHAKALGDDLHFIGMGDQVCHRCS